MGHSVMQVMQATMGLVLKAQIRMPGENLCHILTKVFPLYKKTSTNKCFAFSSVPFSIYFFS